MAVIDLSRDAGLVERIYTAWKEQSFLDQSKPRVLDTGDGSCVKLYGELQSHYWTRQSFRILQRMNELEIKSPHAHGIVRCGRIRNTQNGMRYWCKKPHTLMEVPQTESLWGLYLERIPGKTLARHFQDKSLSSEMIERLRVNIEHLLGQGVVFRDILFLENAIANPAGEVYLIDPASYVFPDIESRAHRTYAQWCSPQFVTQILAHLDTLPSANSKSH